MADDDEDDEEEPPQLVMEVERSSYDYSLRSSTAPTKVIPVTILTGFLGAGKSMLLNHILRNSGGMRIAVIENEFSSGLGIEGMIVKNGIDGSNIDNFFELNNGCICCTVKDSLVSTLEQLALHRDRFEYILIETTGLANPGKIINIFWTDEALGSVLRLDGVVTVVDALNVARYMAESDTSADFSSQIAYADRLVINKCDLVTEAQLREVENIVKSINSYAEISTSSFSKVEPSWLLHTESFSGYRFESVASKLESLFTKLDSEFCSPCVPPSSQAHIPHSADSLRTWGFQIEGVFEKTLLSRFLDDILYSNGESMKKESINMQIFRIKGIVYLSGENYVHIVQAVHELFEFSASELPAAIPVNQLGAERRPPMNKIIVIGRNIEKNILEKGLRGALSQ